MLQQIDEDRRLQLEGTNAHQVHFDNNEGIDMSDEKNVKKYEDYCGEQFISSLTNYGKEILCN